MNQARSFLLGLLIAVGGCAIAANFPVFSPATGILKGNANTYVTSAATSTDIRGLWTGTCDSTTYLRGDGSCNTPAGGGGGSGTVTSAALTVPAGLSVSGSPITSAGTFAITTTLSGPMRGNGSGFITGSLALGSEVSGLLPVANGGIGVGALTGIALGNGTSAFTAAASSNVIALWTGTCSSSTFLKGDGSCGAPAGSGTVTSIGLTGPGGVFGVSGSPVTTSGSITLSVTGTSGGIPYFSGSGTLSSSGALTASALMLGGGAGVAPTVLGSLGTTSTVLHGNAAGAPTFGAVANGDLANSAITINGASTSLGGSRTLTLASSDFSGQGTTSTLLHGNASGAPSFGAVALASDVSGTLADARLSANVALLNGAQNFSSAPTITSKAVCLADGTNCPGTAPTTGSFSITMADCSSGGTGTIFYRVINNIATLWVTAAITCTSNGTALSISGLPTAVNPAHARTIQYNVINNGAGVLASAAVLTSNAIVMAAAIPSGSFVTTPGGGFTASGSKGLGAGFTITYPLD